MIAAVLHHRELSIGMKYVVITLDPSNRVLITNLPCLAMHISHTMWVHCIPLSTRVGSIEAAAVREYTLQ